MMSIIGTVAKRARTQSMFTILMMTSMPRKRASTSWTVPKPVNSSTVSRSVVNHDMIEPTLVSW